MTTYALQRDRRQAAPDDFPDQLTELLAYFSGTLPPEHPFARLAPYLPGRPELPEPWLLGSSPQSAIWAGQLGLPYAFADFINQDGADIAATYRRRFAADRAGAGDRAPRTAVAVWAVCAPTDEEARQLAASRRMTMRLLRQGRLIPVPPPEQAIAWLRAQGLPDTGAAPGRRTVVGSPERVREGLLQTAEDYGAEEVIVVTITFDHEARRRSYELLAAAMELEPRDADLTPSATATL